MKRFCGTCGASYNADDPCWVYDDKTVYTIEDGEGTPMEQTGFYVHVHEDGTRHRGEWMTPDHHRERFNVSDEEIRNAFTRLVDINALTDADIQEGWEFVLCDDDCPHGHLFGIHGYLALPLLGIAFRDFPITSIEDSHFETIDAAVRRGAMSEETRKRLLAEMRALGIPKQDTTTQVM